MNPEEPADPGAAAPAETVPVANGAPQDATVQGNGAGTAVETETLSADALFARIRDGLNGLPIRAETAASLAEVIFGDEAIDRVDRAVARLLRENP